MPPRAWTSIAATGAAGRTAGIGVILLALGAAPLATAEPVRLTDAHLDRVTAGGLSFDAFSSAFADGFGEAAFSDTITASSVRAGAADADATGVAVGRDGANGVAVTTVGFQNGDAVHRVDVGSDATSERAVPIVTQAAGHVRVGASRIDLGGNAAAMGGAGGAQAVATMAQPLGDADVVMAGQADSVTGPAQPASVETSGAVTADGSAMHATMRALAGSGAQNAAGAVLDLESGVDGEAMSMGAIAEAVERDGRPAQAEVAATVHDEGRFQTAIVTSTAAGKGTAPGTAPRAETRASMSGGPGLTLVLTRPAGTGIVTATGPMTATSTLVRIRPFSRP